MPTMPLTAVSHGENYEPSRLHRVMTTLASRMTAARERLMVRESLSELRELDEFMLRDIGANGDEIYRVHQMRNGQRPTLLVG
ncbi:MAG: hypothetical protein ABI391_08190 [Hyphomicrobiaceae bacterium]